MSRFKLYSLSAAAALAFTTAPLLAQDAHQAEEIASDVQENERSPYRLPVLSEDKSKKDKQISLGDHFYAYHDKKTGLKYEAGKSVTIDISYDRKSEIEDGYNNPHDVNHQQRQEYTVGLKVRF